MYLRMHHLLAVLGAATVSLLTPRATKGNES